MHLTGHTEPPEFTKTTRQVEWTRAHHLYENRTMLTLIALAMLASPTPTPYTPSRDYNPDTDPCAGLEAGEWHRCQPRVVNLGKWDVRPAADKWPESVKVDEPKAWGEYPTEKQGQ